MIPSNDGTNSSPSFYKTKLGLDIYSSELYKKFSEADV